MIQPIIAAQVSTPATAIQHNADSQGVLHNQNATQQVREEARQIKETVVQKEEAVLYEQRHDAKEEGRNKYENLYSNKKKKNTGNQEQNTEQAIKRVNFDIKI